MAHNSEISNVKRTRTFEGAKRALGYTTRFTEALEEIHENEECFVGWKITWYPERSYEPLAEGLFSYTRVDGARVEDSVTFRETTLYRAATFVGEEARLLQTCGTPYKRK